MKLFQNLIEKKERENWFYKKDLCIYVEMMDSPIVRKDKDYVMIGYYDSGYTSFTDILKHKTYEFDQPKVHPLRPVIGEPAAIAEINKVSIGDRDFSLISDKKNWSYNAKKKKSELNIHVIKPGKCDWFKKMKVATLGEGKDGACFVRSVMGRRFLYRFINASALDVFDIEELKIIKEIINNYAHKEIKKMQEKTTEISVGD
jgi:hypothetical protein